MERYTSIQFDMSQDSFTTSSVTTRQSSRHSRCSRMRWGSIVVATITMYWYALNPLDVSALLNLAALGPKHRTSDANIQSSQRSNNGTRSSPVQPTLRSLGSSRCCQPPRRQPEDSSWGGYPASGPKRGSFGGKWCYQQSRWLTNGHEERL